MKTMKHKYRIVHGHAEWTGRTKREALGARDADLATVYDADPYPEVVHCFEHVGVVWFNPRGPHYSYTIAECPAANGAMGHSCVTSGAGSMANGGWTREEAERHMRRDLAQRLYVYGERTGLDVIRPNDHEGIYLHAGWVRFQDAYAAAIAAGRSTEEARQAADRAIGAPHAA